MIRVVFIAAVIASAAAGVAGWTVQGWRMGKQIATLEAEHSEALAESMAQAAALTADYQARAEQAQEGLTHARTRIATLESSLARTVVSERGLRDQLSAFAGGRTDDSLTACHARAGALASSLTEGAGLLAEGAELAREAARRHDERAAEVIALLNGWPRALVP